MVLSKSMIFFDGPSELARLKGIATGICVGRRIVLIFLCCGILILFVRYILELEFVKILYYYTRTENHFQEKDSETYSRSFLYTIHEITVRIRAMFCFLKRHLLIG